MEDLQNDKAFYMRVYVGIGIAMLATALGVATFQRIARFHWLVLLGTIVLASGYFVYLYLHEPGRMRSFLKSYLIAAIVIFLLPYTILPFVENFLLHGKGGAENFINLSPLLVMLGGVVRTHLIGAEPDVIVQGQGGVTAVSTTQNTGGGLLSGLSIIGFIAWLLGG